MEPNRPKVAFFDFSSCEGCQLTVVDSLQTHPDLLNAVEIVQFREAMSEKSDDYLVAFIEGSCTRREDEPRLQKIRERAKAVIALGACAHLGGVNAVRNWMPLDEAKAYVYGPATKTGEAYAVRPIGAVIPLDGFIPGCPIDRDEFVRVVKALLQGRRPLIPDEMVCTECKLRENLCVILQKKVCLGPLVRAGCGAICPHVGVGCEGCRGLISNPNIKSLEATFVENGLGLAEIAAKKRLFLSYQLMESEAEGHGDK